MPVCLWSGPPTGRALLRPAGGSRATSGARRSKGTSVGPATCLSLPQGKLVSGGEWRDADGRPLYRLLRQNQACHARGFYFDETGQITRTPQRVYRRPAVPALGAERSEASGARSVQAGPPNQEWTRCAPTPTGTRMDAAAVGSGSRPQSPTDQENRAGCRAADRRYKEENRGCLFGGGKEVDAAAGRISLGVRRQLPAGSPCDHSRRPAPARSSWRLGYPA